MDDDGAHPDDDAHLADDAHQVPEARQAPEARRPPDWVIVFDDSSLTPVPPPPLTDAQRSAITDLRAAAERIHVSGHRDVAGPVREMTRLARSLQADGLDVDAIAVEANLSATKLKQMLSRSS